MDQPVPNQTSSYLPSVFAHTIVQSQPGGAQVSYQPSRCGSPAVFFSSNIIADRSPVTLQDTEAPNPKYARIQASITKLQHQISEKTGQLEGLCQQLIEAGVVGRKDDMNTDSPSSTAKQEEILSQAQAIVSRHIKLLHRYNEIKDIGMGLLGLIADMEGRRLADVMADRGVNEKD